MLNPAIAKSLNALFNVQVVAVNVLSSVLHAHGIINDEMLAARQKTQQECRELFEKLLTAAQSGVAVTPAGGNDNEPVDDPAG